MRTAKLEQFGTVLAFSPRPDHRPVVILADPDRATCAHTERMLVGSGYTVLTTDCPTELGMLLERRKVDAVLISLSFPKGTKEATRRIRVARPLTPMIFLRNGEPLEQAIAVMKDGASDVLQSPVEFGALGLSLDAARRKSEEAEVAQEHRRQTELRFAQTLSLAEREVVQLYAEGLSTKEVAEELGVSQYALRFLRLDLLAKLQARNMCEAMRIIFSR